MAEDTEVQTEAVQAETAAAEQTQPVAPGEKAERVYKQAEVEAMIRDRLAGANRKAEEAAKKAAADAEAKALKEQGEFKTLFERTQAELEAERSRAKALELASMKRDIAAKVGLPAGLAARLQGDDEATLEADAKQLLDSLPKPSAPNINAASGSNGAAPADSLYGGMTESEFAAVYGVNPRYLKQ